MSGQVVRVALSERSYDIHIGAGNLASIGTLVQAQLKPVHAVLIADARLAATHAATCEASLAATGMRVTTLLVPSGEKSKSVEQSARLWNEMLAAKTDRRSVVVAVGGGVIGDLAGFVAATFGRGLPFVQVPTTLLAQVDSSVGGKVGINLPAAKNMVGAFWQPRLVLIDTAVLHTLPEREYLSGLAEVVKYGVILDAPFFAALEQSAAALLARDTVALTAAIKRSCELKADVVRQDEREETGLRAVLNYGHTFAHAIETVAGYEALLHGEAVSIGMVQAARLATLLGRIDEAFCVRQKRLLDALQLPTVSPPLAADDLVAAMQRDKKVERGLLRFVLPTKLGHVELVGGVEEALVRQTLAANC
ncbi:3-dehydroquinate synthase [Pirellula staleyi DSM 6068]|uniref:3-dehydroquinate synthase n=1 Tax=Pirellula staleyi (strain ATCC 27377 / DSM 6068 / ICPB 4128) TaxID=530564 RepID=D2R8D3_PIRSD|nr:3-dehydroquinate synthase [Pirellula staleyi]ADB15750.1 3-dehydroquinate synthase [Pirellula staleyi DSM 6068]